MNGAKLIQIYLWISITILHPLYQEHDTKSLLLSAYCWCLPCNYVAKPFGILHRVIKSQKVYTSFKRSKIWYLFSQKSFWLNFQTCFCIFMPNENVIISKKSDHTIVQLSRKKCFFFVHIRKCPHTSNYTWKLSHTLSHGFTY